MLFRACVAGAERRRRQSLTEEMQIHVPEAGEPNRSDCNFSVIKLKAEFFCFLQSVGDLSSFDKHWPFLKIKEEIFCVDCQRLSNQGSSKSVLCRNHMCAVLFSSYNHMIQFHIKFLISFQNLQILTLYPKH